MVLKEILNRCSVREFSEKNIPENVLKDILEAGRLAPSWLNTQPWRFIVVRDKRNKSLLSQLAHGQKHVENADTVIICCADESAWQEDNFRKTIESKPGITQDRVELMLKNPAINPSLKSEEMVTLRTIEGLTYAVAYMTIQAQVNGVGACVIGAIGNELTESVPEVTELVRHTFNIKPHLKINSLLALGYPVDAFTPPEKLRKPANEVISFEKI